MNVRSRFVHATLVVALLADLLLLPSLLVLIGFEPGTPKRLVRR